MRRKREPESNEQRSQRVDRLAQARADHASAEAQAMDAAVRRSIQQFGP